MKKRIIAGVLFLAALLALVVRASHVTVPENTGFGSGWNMYHYEPENSIDLLFLGSSLAYCDVVPAELYAETGLTGFVMAGPEQTVCITYYYLREAFRTQSPSAVFLELTGVMFSRYMGYTKANIGRMPYWSLNRLRATLEGAEKEQRAGLFFPLYNYHDRFNDPTSLFRRRGDERLDPLAGFTFMTGSQPQEKRVEREYDISEEDFAGNLEYLKLIEELCAEHGSELVLFQAPTCAPLPDRSMERIRGAVSPDTLILDFSASPLFEETGLDMNTDFYDNIHTNAVGAQKFSAALGREILRRMELAPCAHDEALWQWRIDYFDEKMLASGTDAG